MDTDVAPYEISTIRKTEEYLSISAIVVYAVSLFVQRKFSGTLFALKFGTKISLVLNELKMFVVSEISDSCEPLHTSSCANHLPVALIAL